MDNFTLALFIIGGIANIATLVFLFRTSAALREAENRMNRQKGRLDGLSLLIKTGGHLGDSKSPETRANADDKGGLPKGDA